MEKLGTDLKYGSRISKEIAKLSDDMLNDNNYLERIRNMASSIRYIDNCNLKYYKNDIVSWLLKFPKEFLNDNLARAIANKYHSCNPKLESEKLNMAFESYLKELKFFGKIK